MGNDSINNLVYLAATIGQARPGVTPIEISKALVKLHKISSTLAKRYYDGDYDSKLVSDFEFKVRDLLAELGLKAEFDRSEDCTFYFVLDGKTHSL